MQDYIELCEAVLKYLQKIAPATATKEKIRQGIEGEIAFNIADLKPAMNLLKGKRWIWNTFENWYYLTPERIAKQEEKVPGYAAEVELKRHGLAASDTPQRESGNGLKPFDNDWCKAMIIDEQARKELMTHIDYRDVEVFRLIIKMWYEFTESNSNFAKMPPVTERPVDYNEAQRYAKKLRHYYDWNPYSTIGGEKEG